MAGNKNLNAAARARKDEFYTQLSDIENELSHYREHFRGKVVLCNCDDPFESQFFYYFAMNFNFLGLSKLIVTSYTGSPIQGNLFDPAEGKTPYRVEINRIDRDPLDWSAVTEMMNELKDALGKNSSATVRSNTLAILSGDGDFRSAECVKLLRQADIVVTNPPFSLFREYVKQLIDHGKKFLIIGNVNCITYKEIFPLIMNNQLWLGVSIHSGDRKFHVPDDYPLNAATCGVDSDGRKFIRVKGVRWFTNLEHAKRNHPIDLVRSYKDNPENFPRYDNYDAIEVSKTLDIPEDYFGVMGVPITFLDKYCPAQFEIIGIANSARWIGYECYTIINGKRIYNRILIRRREHGN
ncbi:MAG: adenine-specific methyltransferase EcoRI family protein [Quinella sp. 2Q5]|nr:adenine-specific methyltransferase EcoRI family protein [Quinella sp. 2Q5]